MDETIKGTPACVGKAVGRAKIVKGKQDFKKLKEGDILVAEHTDPSMVVIMAKAAAIVTDMGGLTSHAAVVSREMGVPCVVGAKNATRLLKDGDFIEVDATKGIVKILKD